MSELRKLISERWENSADGFNGFVQKELNGESWLKWRDSILEDVDSDHLEILDIGTGPGFFAIILASCGYNVTAIDMAEEMIKTAKKNAGELGLDIDFRTMDADVTDFKDKSFDILVSRNVTWTLEHPEATYKEWFRLLKPGGKLLIYDANWYLYKFDDAIYRKYKADIAAHDRVYPPVKHSYRGNNPKAAEYFDMLPLSNIKRPDWDLEALREAGFQNIYFKRNINEEVYDEERKMLYRNIPMFKICAVK